MAIGLFFLLPVGITSLFGDALPNAVVFVLVEKLIRISIFLAYLWAVSRMKDLQRVFEYHGAEHKTISCYEAGVPLTPENAQRFSRLHPRCGTSFLLIVMIVAVVVFAPLGTPGVVLAAALARRRHPAHRRPRVRGHQVVRAQPHQALGAASSCCPGMKLQLLTTREPDLGQLAVAIAALEAVLAVESPRRGRARRTGSGWRSWPSASAARAAGAR